MHSYYGGRVANSGIFLNRPTHIVSTDSHAKYKGGAIAIYVQTQIAFSKLTLTSATLELIFSSSLYIQTNVAFMKFGKASGLEVVETIFILNNTKSDSSAIAPDPIHICSCM